MKLRRSCAAFAASRIRSSSLSTVFSYSWTISIGRKSAAVDPITLRESRDQVQDFDITLDLLLYVRACRILTMTSRPLCSFATWT